MSIVVCGNGHMYQSPDHILLFEQINIAKCAMERAKAADTRTQAGSERFRAEFDSARLWARRGNPVQA